jgi:hypothetical protein
MKRFFLFIAMGVASCFLLPLLAIVWIIEQVGGE